MGSFDPDHALAIMLQAKFNEEIRNKKKKNKENESIAIQTPSLKMSLTDPEWETTDPCPDIHGLFLAFNDRFFWGKLLSVEVKWSQQMTSCAGVCVYEGRNGLCSVRLSAPLLKLRPRSDLVETLLHEMIHAYLFVTHNNKDREGHGPEFHKHMYRINKEAGTKITVYHSFHAEVKEYQQHWWRCNGPCQHRAPFFGMVKRAKNRAPGPNDLWWTGHQAVCSGHFVKVREPENYKNKKKDVKAVSVNTKKDIRNFFKKPVNKTESNDKVGQNIFGLSNVYNKASSATEVNHSIERGIQVNRVTGFKDLSSASSAPPKPVGNVNGERSTNTPIRQGGMLANKGGRTLTVTGSQWKNKPESPGTKLRVDNFKVFSGPGFTLGGSSHAPDRTKSCLLNLGDEPKEKKRKIKDIPSSSNDECLEKYINTNDMCNCSVCNERVPRDDIDEHLEACVGLQNVFSNTSTVDETEINHINQKYKLTSCPICTKHVTGDINAHVDECLNASGIINVFEESPIEVPSDNDTSDLVIIDDDTPKPIENKNCDIEFIESENRIACPICGMRFGESRINEHVNYCIDSE